MNIFFKNVGNNDSCSTVLRTETCDDKEYRRNSAATAVNALIKLSDQVDALIQLVWSWPWTRDGHGSNLLDPIRRNPLCYWPNSTQQYI